MKEVIGFLDTEEIKEYANNIGDVRTPEGKSRMIEFLAKSIKAIETDDYAYDAVVDAFFINFLTKSPVNDKEYYFENGKLKAGFDNIDGIIGNCMSNFENAIYYGETPIIDSYQRNSNCTFRDYTYEEKERLQLSCF